MSGTTRPPIRNCVQDDQQGYDYGHVTDLVSPYVIRSMPDVQRVRRVPIVERQSLLSTANMDRIARTWHIARCIIRKHASVVSYIRDITAPSKKNAPQYQGECLHLEKKLTTFLAVLQCRIRIRLVKQPRKEKLTSIPPAGKP